MEIYNRLIQAATEVRKKAYAPYSNFKVGAAVLTKEGKVFTGCNVENASYGLSICAERVAIFKAISEGYKNFIAIAVVADTETPVKPCGACRQVMAEFGNYDVIMANLKGDVRIMKVSELLPEAFSPDDLK